MEDNWQNGGRTKNGETLSLVKFQIPALPAGQDASLFKYRVRIYGGKVETDGADQIFFYPASSDWNPESVSGNVRPACSYNSDAVLYFNHKREYRLVNVDKAVRKRKPRAHGTSAAIARGIIISLSRPHPQRV